jgi:hypothetical protein
VLNATSVLITARPPREWSKKRLRSGGGLTRVRSGALCNQADIDINSAGLITAISQQLESEVASSF